MLTEQRLRRPKSGDQSQGECRAIIADLQAERDQLCAEVARLAGLVDRYARLALTDPLTGLPNRRGFDAALESEMARADRAASAASASYCSISTASRRSTTGTATLPATSSSSRRRRPGVLPCALATT